MHRIMTYIFALVACAAYAFSSESWLAERGDDSDMLRLKAAYADCLSKVESPAENVVLPLEHHPDGTVKSRLKAARAQLFIDSGLVWAEGIRVEQFNADGTLALSLEAENCIVDRKSKTGWVDGVAKMTYGDSSVRGRGVHFSIAREYVKIYAQSEIRTKSLAGKGIAATLEGVK